MCDVGYLCANFSLPSPLCSQLRPDVRDRQTSDTHHRLMPPLWGQGIIIIIVIVSIISCSKRTTSIGISILYSAVSISFDSRLAHCIPFVIFSTTVLSITNWLVFVNDVSRFRYSSIKRHY